MAVDQYGPKNEPIFLASGAPEIDVDPGEVAKYAAKVGNRRTGTTTERNALAGKDVWAGLEFWDNDLSAAFIYRGAGWVPRDGVSAFASKSGAQAFTNNQAAVITWDTLDLGGGITHSAGVFTVPAAGWYDVFAEMNQFSTSAGSNRFLYATKNGTAVGSTRCLTRTTGGSGVSSNEWSPRSFELLAAGDTIRFMALQDSGGNANLLIASCGIVYVRPAS